MYLGQALLKVGETEQRIGEAQNEFSGHIREGYVKALEAYMADMKSYKVYRLSAYPNP